MSTGFSPSPKLFLVRSIISLSIVVVCVSYFFISPVQENSSSVPALMPEARGSREHVITMLTDDEVTVGVDRLTSKPYLHLGKWDDEVSLKIKIPYRVAVNPVQTGSKLVYESVPTSQAAWWQKIVGTFVDTAAADEPDVDVVVYTHQPKDVEYDVDGTSFTYVENENGGVEFDAVFNEPLVDNVVSFEIDSRGLEFEYQPPLNEEPMMPGVTECSETTCWNEEGEAVSYRPENVVRSYAVYYNGGKAGDWTKLGGKDYKTGKVFHIYRPKIYDAAGTEVWGELKIEDNYIKVVVPQDFLDQAVYPVTVDPSFGYTSIGASSSSWTSNFPRGTIYALSEDGEAQSITTYSRTNTTGTHYGYFAIYDSAATANLMGSTTPVVNTQNGAWMTGNINVPANLTAGNYRVVSNHVTGHSFYVYYDSAVSPNYPIQYRSGVNPPSWPSTLNSWTQYAYQRVSSYVTYGSSNPDVTPPTVSLTSPSDATATSSNVFFAANASDDDAVAGVSFFVNGILQGGEDTSSPYSMSWNSTATSSGSKIVVAVARDDSNNYATSSSVTITLDNTAPSVSLTSPSNGASLSGSITLSADASDTSGISGVSFFVNGILQGSQDTSSPYSISWDSTATSSGSKSIVAVARDTLGNVATSTAANITTGNLPTPTSVSATNQVPHIVVSWNTPVVASSRVYFGPTTDYSSSTPESDTSPRVTSHSVTLTELPVCTHYHFIVVSRDAFGGTATSSDDTFSTDGCTGNASIASTQAGNITTAAGGSVSNGAITIVVPTSFTNLASAATFQANELDPSQFFGSASTPSGKDRAGDTAFNLKAITSGTDTITTFTAPIEVTLSYSDGDVDELVESSLWIYRYDGSDWYPLVDCEVDTVGNTVTCTTTSFSDFAVFGDGSPSSSGGGGGSSGSSGRSGGTSVISRVNSLIKNGNAGAALDLVRQYPSIFSNNDVIALNTQSTIAPSTPISSSVPHVDGVRDLDIGMEGSDVSSLQGLLIAAAKGPSAQELKRIGPTGHFGQHTKNALGEYQIASGILPHAGYFGPITREYMKTNTVSGVWW